MIEGELEMTVAGETARAGPGSAVIVPSDALHSVRALKSGRALIASHPARSDEPNR